MTREVWHLVGHQATLKHPSLRLAVDLAHPESGVQEICFASQDWPNLRASRLHLAGSAAPSAEETGLAEAYVRGDDLVASYAEAVVRPYRVQVYWRFAEFASESPSLVGWETIVSVQTSRWDIDPRMELRTTCDGSCRMTSTLPGSFALRNGGQGYLEILHPAGSHRSECRPTADGGWEITHTLFGGFLEKGVLLRARLLSLFAPKVFEESVIVRIRDQFFASEPVLTA